MYNLLKITEVTKDLKVLYVEDNTILREEIKDVIEDFFDTVITAENGQVGLTKYEEYYNSNGNYFDIVITDIHMPIKDGITMIGDIKQINKEQPIIVISAYNDSEYLIDLIQLGISNFILKPIAPDQLLNTLYETSRNIINAKEKEKFLHTQSKLALVGTMIENIAHQWRQPLAEINSVVFSVDALLESQKIQNDKLNKKLARIEDITMFMSQTIGDFQNFFNSKKEKETFHIETAIDDALRILQNTLKSKKIFIVKEMKGSGDCFGIDNELQQVIIVLLNNAIDALEENNIENKIIKIKLDTKNGSSTLEICDNAGKVSEEVFNKIFTKHFSTKDEGIGLGLFLAKTIMEKSFNSEIEAKNNETGSCFKLTLHKKA